METLVSSEARLCDKHGEYKSILIKYKGREGWSECMHCTMEKIKSERQNASVETNAEIRKNKKNYLIKNASIPIRFSSASLDKYIVHNEMQKKVINSLRSYLDSFDEIKKKGISLGFIGNIGTGKTYLACALALELIEKGYAPIFILTKELINEIRATWSRDSFIPEDAIKRKYISSDLLILDEIGVQFGSESEKNIIFEIINGRYLKLLPTIIISNLKSKEELKEYLGERSYDRLRENGGKIIIFNWESFRGNK